MLSWNLFLDFLPYFLFFIESNNTGTLRSFIYSATNTTQTLHRVHRARKVFFLVTPGEKKHELSVKHEGNAALSSSRFYSNVFSFASNKLVGGSCRRVSYFFWNVNTWKWKAVRHVLLEAAARCLISLPQLGVFTVFTAKTLMVLFVHKSTEIKSLGDISLQKKRARGNLQNFFKKSFKHQYCNWNIR